jgi:hypothetical protein
MRIRLEKIREKFSNIPMVFNCRGNVIMLVLSIHGGDVEFIIRPAKSASLLTITSAFWVANVHKAASEGLWPSEVAWVTGSEGTNRSGVGMFSSNRKPFTQRLLPRNDAS